MGPPDTWNPAQYERFRTERSQPFFDLMNLVELKGGMRVLDLGSGTGELTRILHRHLQAGETLGIDSSEAMLARSAEFRGEGLHFARDDIATFVGGPFDLIFSNAALQWVPNHEIILPRLTTMLSPGGQLAIQVPANDDHPSHRVAAEVAGEPLFQETLHGYVHSFPVLTPEAYAALLDQLGYQEQHVRLQVYVHHLPSTQEVVEWAKGTLLTDYRRRLPADLYDQFLTRYRERLLQRLDQVGPYLYLYKRILMWGKR